MPKKQLNDLGVQVRLCLNCSKPFVVPSGSTKVYCSVVCRRRFHDKLKRRRRWAKDPEKARASLERLLEWKRQQKAQQKNETGKADSSGDLAHSLQNRNGGGSLC